MASCRKWEKRSWGCEGPWVRTLESGAKAGPAGASWGIMTYTSDRPSVVVLCPARSPPPSLCRPGGLSLAG